MRRNTMRPQSDKKLATEEASKSREFLSSLATAETARTASHIIIAGNAMLSSSASPLLSSSLNSIFSSVATAITYGRTPQKIQQARLEDLKTLLENSRPLFSTEMKTFFAESTSYQKLKKQFEALDQKYFAALESEFKTFQPLMLAIGSIGVFYFVARLVQDNDELNWTETIAVLGMIGMMSYSNVHSHRDLVMCSRKDYQEFIEALIQFNTHVIDEVPVLKVITTLEQTKKEMEKCEEELRKLGVEMPKIREADEGGVEESKGEEKSLAQRVEERLQSLVEERNKEIKEISIRTNLELARTTLTEEEIAARERSKKAMHNAWHQYRNTATSIKSCIRKLQNLHMKYHRASEELRELHEKFIHAVPVNINEEDIVTLERKFPDDEPISEETTVTLSAVSEFGLRI